MRSHEGARSATRDHGLRKRALPALSQERHKMRRRRCRVSKEYLFLTLMTSYDALGHPTTLVECFVGGIVWRTKALACFSEAVGRMFESCWAHQTPSAPVTYTTLVVFVFRRADALEPDGLRRKPPLSRLPRLLAGWLKARSGAGALRRLKGVMTAGRGGTTAHSFLTSIESASPFRWSPEESAPRG
jgi:hypothetical protein